LKVRKSHPSAGGTESVVEYEKFNKQQRIESDFDREVKKLLQKEREE
jgi:hypothetical protein